MYPTPLKPDDTGCLVVLIERGIPSGTGEIGARKPSRWLCTFWASGEVRQRELLCDLVWRAPTFTECSLDLYNHPARWRRLAPKLAPSA